MPVYVPHLQQYATRPPCARPSSGISAPEGLIQELAAQHLELADDTHGGGNCGPHAFGISLMDEASHNRSLHVTHRFKKCREHSKTPQMLIHYLRSVASHHMAEIADAKVWDQMPFKTLAVAMAGVPGSTYGDLIRSVAKDTEWIDGVDVDVLIFQMGMDPCILGCSLMGKTPLGMLKIAMINDYHYWGVRTSREELPRLLQHNGDHVAIPRPSPDELAVDVDVDLNRWHEDIVLPLHPCMSDDDVGKEFALCEALTTWDPFREPEARVIEAMNDLAGVTGPRDEGHRFLLRHAVIEQLASRLHATSYMRALPATLQPVDERKCAET